MPYWDMPEALGDRSGLPVVARPGRRAAGRRPPWALDPRSRRVRLLGRVPPDRRAEVPHLRQGRHRLDQRACEGHRARRLVRPADKEGKPANDGEDPKRIFDVASLGLAFGMYYNVTRDPEVEADLLEVRDFVFEHYYDPATSRIKDALKYDLSEEIDLGDNGGDITNYLVPGSALLLPNADLLSDPARRAQFRDDLRVVTEQLIARHRGTGAESSWFWGRTGLVGRFGSGDTDFGHSIKSHELILNANAVFPDRPWSGLSADREALLQRAWDAPAARWNQRRSGPVGAGTERDSEWWMHDEADQTLAALDLGNGFAHQDWLAASAASWTSVFVDRTRSARETFFRPARNPALAEMRKTGFGKNMYHVSEHALIMFLHGRALEGLPARLHYAFPTTQALTAQAEPYWFDATGERRVVRTRSRRCPVTASSRSSSPASVRAARHRSRHPTTRPPRPRRPWCPPSRTPRGGTARTSRSRSPPPTQEWASRRSTSWWRTGAGPRRPSRVIEPGDTVVLPAMVGEGVRRVTYWAVDRLGNTEQPRVLEVRIDRTSPTLAGLPSQPCTLWPPDRRMVQVAQVTGADALSGVAGVQVAVSADEPTGPDDSASTGGRSRCGRPGTAGGGRTYLVQAIVTDAAGNTTPGEAECTVPHDQRR